MNARPTASAAPPSAAGPDAPAAIAEPFSTTEEHIRVAPPLVPSAEPPHADKAATREAADSAACIRCGVCCFSRSETYVRVTGDDWTRLGPDADLHAHFIGHRAYLRMLDGHCAALSIRSDPATGATHHVCTIYERRPQICRDLARGSPECEGELAIKGDRPAA